MNLYYEMYINIRFGNIKLKGARGEPLLPIPLWSQTNESLKNVIEHTI